MFSLSLNRLKKKLMAFKSTILSSPINRDKVQTSLCDVIEELTYIKRMYEYAKVLTSYIEHAKTNDILAHALNLLVRNVEDALAERPLSEVLNYAHRIMRMLRDNIAGKYLYLDSEIRQEGLNFIIEIEKLVSAIDQVETNVIAKEACLLLDLLYNISSELGISRRIIIPRLYVEAVKVVLSKILNIDIEEFKEPSINRIAERIRTLYNPDEELYNEFISALKDFLRLDLRTKIMIQLSDDEYRKLTNVCRRILSLTKTIVSTKDALESITDLS